MVFYLRSGSDALLLDGLYTAVMAGASVIAGQVNRAALQPRSRAYPFGTSVTVRKDDAPAAVQAANVNVAGLGSSTGGGGLIQTTSG